MSSPAKGERISSDWSSSEMAWGTSKNDCEGFKKLDLDFSASAPRSEELKSLDSSKLSEPFSNNDANACDCWVDFHVSNENKTDEQV